METDTRNTDSDLIYKAYDYNFQVSSSPILVYAILLDHSSLIVYLYKDIILLFLPSKYYIVTQLLAFQNTSSIAIYFFYCAFRTTVPASEFQVQILKTILSIWYRNISPFSFTLLHLIPKYLFTYAKILFLLLHCRSLLSQIFIVINFPPQNPSL